MKRKYMGQESKMHGYYVWDVFPERCQLTGILEQYHQDTGQPIYLPQQKKPPPPCAPSLAPERLLPQHLEMIRSFLPRRVLREARAAHYRALYHRFKLRVVFIGEALHQMRDYDPFFVVMDDVHEADAMLTSMTSAMAYYADRMVS